MALKNRRLFVVFCYLVAHQMKFLVTSFLFILYFLGNIDIINAATANYNFNHLLSGRDDASSVLSFSQNDFIAAAEAINALRGNNIKTYLNKIDNIASPAISDAVLWLAFNKLYSDRRLTSEQILQVADIISSYYPETKYSLPYIYKSFTAAINSPISPFSDHQKRIFMEKYLWDESLCLENKILFLRHYVKLLNYNTRVQSLIVNNIWSNERFLQKTLWADFLKENFTMITNDSHHNQLKILIYNNAVDTIKNYYNMLNKYGLEAIAKDLLPKKSFHAGYNANSLLQAKVDDIAIVMAMEKVGNNFSLNNKVAVLLKANCNSGVYINNLLWDQYYRIIYEVLHSSLPYRYEIIDHLSKKCNILSEERALNKYFINGFVNYEYLKNYSQAARQFNAMKGLAKTATAKAKASYWLGLTYNYLDQEGNLSSQEFIQASQFPLSFYGQLAVEKLNGGVHKAIALHLSASAPQQTMSNLNNKVGINILIGGILCKIGQRWQGINYLEKGITYNKNEVVTLYYLKNISQFLDKRTNLYLGKVGVSYNVVMLDWSYPDWHNLELPSLAKALIRQETNFDSNMVSSKGAYGIMQLQHPTAEWIAQRLKLKYDYKKLSNDKYNQYLGVEYLNFLIKKYNYNHALALAAYNAGPQKVQKWIKTLGMPQGGDKKNVINWIESISYPTTRNYIMRSLEAMVVYDAIVLNYLGR